MQKDFSIIVFLSGRGTNFASLLDASQHYNITHVLSDKPEAFGLKTAQSAGIATFCRPRSEFSTVKEQKSWLYSKAESCNPDLIVLAGYMQIIEPNFVKRWYGKMINIHPSLLPRYPGLHTHKRALESGDKEHGCTVHYVDTEVDAGPTIAQARCLIHKDDSAETLAARVLPLEHQLLPWCVQEIALGNIWLKGGSTVEYAECTQKDAQLKNFELAP